MFDRRESFRKPVSIFFNKFLGGHPYLCRTLDVSPNGILAEVFGEPEDAMTSFPIELRLPGDPDSVWAWARAVRREGRRQAIEVMSTDPASEHRLARFMAVHPA